MPRPTAAATLKALRAAGTPEKARASAWFFKTGPGEYGYGDKFLGLTVPEMRRIARQFRDLPLGEVAKLLASPWHEARSTALEILVMRYEAARKRGDEKQVAVLVRFYLSHRGHINNWDLVDGSAPYLLGEHLIGRSDRGVLHRLARSKSLWDRRIAMVSCLTLIRARDFGDPLQIAETLLSDKHDLMHKAVGWMLREVGKQSETILTGFLDEHGHRMPRTALRYAIERMSELEKRRYMTMGKKAAAAKA
jgi:3-methyladenine DNA glycosylase AlkD